MMINVYNEEGLLTGDLKGCTHAYSLKSIRDNIDIYVDDKGDLAKTLQEGFHDDSMKPQTLATCALVNIINQSKSLVKRR